MIIGTFLAFLALTVGNWVLVPNVMKKQPTVALKIYTPSAILFTIFTVCWAIKFGAPYYGG